MADTPKSNKTSRTPQANPPDDYVLSAQSGRRSSQRMGLGEAVIKSFIRSIASSIGRIIVRTIQRRMR